MDILKALETVTQSIKAWTLKNIQNTVPKYTTISLLADNWIGSTSPWSQVVTISGVTTYSKIDLQPTAVQICEMQDNDIAFMTENDDGVITVYAIGNRPEQDYILQALVTEVVAL